MYRLELGVACACVASILFDLAVALQALEARDVPREHGLRPSLLGRLVARPRWFFATLLAAAGWPFHIAALLLAPLTVVQPALASGLLLLLVLGDRMLGESVGTLEVGAVLAIIVGVAGLAWAAPEHTTSHAGFLRLAPALGGLAAAGGRPLSGAAGDGGGERAAAAERRLRLRLDRDLEQADRGLPLVVDVGRGRSPGRPPRGWSPLFGLLSEMSALQRRPATRVAPVVFVVQITVPVMLAPLVSGESWASTPLGGRGAARLPDVGGGGGGRAGAHRPPSAG